MDETNSARRDYYILPMLDISIAECYEQILQAQKRGILVSGAGNFIDKQGISGR